MSFLLFFLMVRKGKLKCKLKEQNLKESRSEVLLGSKALQDPPRLEFEGGLMIPYNIIIEADTYQARLALELK